MSNDEKRKNEKEEITQQIIEMLKLLPPEETEYIRDYILNLFFK